MSRAQVAEGDSANKVTVRPSNERLLEIAKDEREPLARRAAAAMAYVVRTMHGTA